MKLAFMDLKITNLVHEKYQHYFLDDVDTFVLRKYLKEKCEYNMIQQNYTQVIDSHVIHVIQYIHKK